MGHVEGQTLGQIVRMGSGTGGIDMKNVRATLDFVRRMLFTILSLRSPEWEQEIGFVGTNG